MKEKICIYHEQSDSELTICIPAPREVAKLTKQLGSKEKALQAIFDKDTPKSAHSKRIVDPVLLPKSRAFRAAWTDLRPTDTIDVDIDKAKEIKLAEIRAERDKKLSKLDTEMLIALEKADKDEISKVKREKQRLRDIPQVIDLSFIEDPDILEKVTIENLQMVTPSSD